MTDDNRPEESPDEQVAALQRELGQLRRAMASYAVVDQAIGVLIAVTGLRSDECWTVLRHTSQNTNIKLREIAQHVLRWVHSGRLPEEIRPKLHAAVLHAHRVRCESEPASGPNSRGEQSGCVVAGPMPERVAVRAAGPVAVRDRCRGECLRAEHLRGEA